MCDNRIGMELTMIGTLASGGHSLRSQLLPLLDPRDPDPSRLGIFRDHNCWKCKNGTEPCVKGSPNQCDYPHARND